LVSKYFIKRLYTKASSRSCLDIDTNVTSYQHERAKILSRSCRGKIGYKFWNKQGKISIFINNEYYNSSSQSTSFM